MPHDFQVPTVWQLQVRVTVRASQPCVRPSNQFQVMAVSCLVTSLRTLETRPWTRARCKRRDFSHRAAACHSYSAAAHTESSITSRPYCLICFNRFFWVELAVLRAVSPLRNRPIATSGFFLLWLNPICARIWRCVEASKQVILIFLRSLNAIFWKKIGEKLGLILGKTIELSRLNMTPRKLNRNQAPQPAM